MTVPSAPGLTPLASPPATRAPPFDGGRRVPIPDVGGAEMEAGPQVGGRATVRVPAPPPGAATGIDGQQGGPSPTERTAEGGPLPTLSRPVLELAHKGDGRSVTVQVIGILTEPEEASAAIADPRANTSRDQPPTVTPGRQRVDSPPAADSGLRTFAAVVGAREPGGRFTLTTPLGELVTLARDVGLAAGMRLLVRIAPGASAGASSTGPTEEGAALAPTGDRAAGMIVASKARPVLAEATALLGRVPQHRIVLHVTMPAAVAPPVAGARPALGGSGAAPGEAGPLPADTANEAATLAVRAVRLPAGRDAEAGPASADGARSSAPPAGDPALHPGEDAASGRSGRAPGQHPSLGARDVVVTSASGLMPAVGEGAPSPAPLVAVDLVRSELGPAHIDGEPAPAEARHAAPRGEAAGTGVAPASLSVLPAGHADMFGLHAVLERDERGTASRLDGDASGHVVIAVELSSVGAVELHLHWTEDDLLVALAVAQDLPNELRADLATALGRWRVEPPAGTSDGADGGSLGR